VSELWEKTVSAHPDSSRLWRHYMQYSLSHLTTMTMTRLRLTISNALRVLAAQKKYYQVSVVHNDVLCYFLFFFFFFFFLFLFWVLLFSLPVFCSHCQVGFFKHRILEYRMLMTLFTMAWVEGQAGYTERATCLYQVCT
jgi:hypothetical protein